MTKFANNLTADELPAMLSHAAMRAHRRHWKDKSHPALINSPGFKPSATQARQIEKLAVCGLSAREIGSVLGVEKSLLEFYYSYELKTAKLRTNASVGRVALKLALDGDHSDMTRFWLKTQAGWKETEVHEHSGIDAAADEARIAREKLLGGDEPSGQGEGTPAG